MLFLILAQVLAPQTPSQIREQFLPQMVAGKPDQAARMFTDAIQASKPEATIAGAWKNETAALGAFKRMSDAKQTPMGSNEVFVRKVEFEKGAITTVVTVNRATLRVEGFQLKPVPKDFVSADYVKQGAFTAEEVKFGAKDWELPGTVLVPVGKGPFPAVVLVHGSGPNDRDESIGANKPFRDLAEGLASKGIVVLRYDKRTLVHGAKMAATATIDTEVVDDAVLGIALLRKRPDVDPKRVTVVGHSLGALLAPEIAQKAKTKGAVLLAPPARKPWEILPQQYRYLGVPEAQVAAMEAQLAAVRDDKESGMVMGAPAAYWKDWAARDGIAVTKALTVPVLVLRGDRDYQVNGDDWAAWRAAFKNDKRVVLSDVLAANHLFIAGTGKPGPAEYEVPGHVVPMVITAIEKFVVAP